MSSINNSNEKEQTNEKKNINRCKKNSTKEFRDDFSNFNMEIKDDIIEPFKDDLFGLNSFEKRMFRIFKDIFTPLESINEDSEEKPKEIKEIKEVESSKEIKEKEIKTETKKEEKEEEPKEEKNDSYFSRIYNCSYNNLNGKEESYTSEAIKQSNNGHNISEIKENYKNSNGICKSAYQRGLDDKTTRFIKEKNIKTGEQKQKKVIKGLEENEINDFNKAYHIYCKKCGFKNLLDLRVFDPFGISKKPLHDGKNNSFFNNLLF
jgi:hypothetical protein